MDWLIILIWITSLSYSAYLFAKWKFTYWSLREVPCLTPTFPHGNLQGASKTRHSREIFDEIYKKFKGKSPFAGIYLTIFPAALIIDLDLIKNILIKDFNYFQDRPLYYNEVRDPLSAHILALRGEKWKNIRATLSPTFSSSRTKFMFSTVIDVARRLVNVIDDDIRCNSVIEIQELMARFTTDVIGNCAFGIDCNSLNDPDSDFRKIGRKYFMKPRHSQFTVFLMAKFPKLAQFLCLKLIPDDISKFFLRITHETIEYREKYSIHRNDFIDMLLPLKAKNERWKEPGELSVNEIAAQAFTFFLAGFETSSTTLCFALYELACNPSIQDKARKQVDELIEAYDGEMTYEAVNEMLYVDQIISETLRKYTPIPRLLRYTTESYKLPGSNLSIERNTPVFIPIYLIHNDPEIYSDPDIFDPDRFKPREINKRHPMTFLGFGDGPRNCLGIRFGRMQTKIAIAYLLRYFQFMPCSETPKQPLRFYNHIEILTCIDGIKLKVKRVK